MRVSFRVRGLKKPVKFVAHPRKCRVPKQLKPFLFKKRTKRLRTMLKKARAGYKAWKRSI